MAQIMSDTCGVLYYCLMRTKNGKNFEERQQQLFIFVDNPIFRLLPSRQRFFFKLIFRGKGVRIGA